MKNTINISISGVAFTLEIDAYKSLELYMQQVERAYKTDSAATEITSDIEARISELVLSWQSEHTTIVTKECIDAIITQMGVPEQPSPEQPVDDNSTYQEKSTVTRRLYRNVQGARLGGVLNGFASYFNIDVTPIRIGMIAIFIIALFTSHGIFRSYGFALLMVISYIVMWIIIPVAKNARQKMEMQGHRITAETLSSNIKNELDSISPNNKNEKTASIFTSLLYAFGRIIRFMFMFVALIIGLLVMLSIITVCGLACTILIDGQNSVNLVIDTNPIWATLLATTCFLAPLLLILYAIIKMFFSLKWNKTIFISLFALWLISWAVGTFTFASNIYDYSLRNTVDNNYSHTLKSDTIIVIPTDNVYKKGFDWKAGIIREKVDINVEENEELEKSQVRVKIRRHSSGRTVDEAIKNCNDIDFKYTLTNDTLTFSNILVFEAPKDKYRGQEIDMNIEVAPGTSIILHNYNYYNRRHISEDDFDTDTDRKNSNNLIIRSKKSSKFGIEIDSSGVNINSGYSKNGSSINIDSTKIEVISIKNGEVVTTVKK
ncbi:MAG: PspC domain-containing protein [Rikenellaceae bacterium]